MRPRNTAFFFVFIWVFGGALLLTSCKSGSVPLQNSTVKTLESKVIVTKHDSLFKTAPDNSYYQAYLDCINGKVVIREPKSTPSKNGALQAPKTTIKDNVLNVDCDLKESELHAKWESEYRLDIATEIKTVEVPVKLPLTWWEMTQIYVGRTLFIGLLLYLIYLCFKYYLKSIKPL